MLIERFEAVDTDENDRVTFDGQAWFGRTYDRANLQLEGEVGSGEIHVLSTELLWSHAIAPFWDTQLGLRHDTAEKIQTVTVWPSASRVWCSTGSM